MNAIGKKWAAKELYEECPACEGDGHVPIRMAPGLKADPENRGNAECPGCAGKGMLPVGLTVGQVGLMEANLDLLLAAAERFVAWDRGPHPTDSGLEPVRSAIRDAIAKARGRS